MQKKLIKKNFFLRNSFLGYFFLRFVFFFPIFFLVIFFNILILKIIPGEESDRILHVSSYRTENSNIKNNNILRKGNELHDIKNINKMSEFFSVFKKYLLFDFGKSNFKNGEVSQIILKKLLNSIPLSLIAILLIFLLSSYFAKLKILYEKTFFDEFITIFLTILNSIPSFVFSLIVIELIFNFNFFSIHSDFEVMNFEFSLLQKIITAIKKNFFPVLILVLTRLIKPTLIINRSIKKEMKEKYFQNLIAFRIPEKKIIMKAFKKNILIECLMLLSSMFNSIFSSLLIIETLFNLDGIGLLFFDGILNRDCPIVLGIIFILSIIKILINFFEDLIIMLIDPRIKFQKLI